MTELTKEYITSLIERQGMTKAEFASKMGYARQNLDVMLAAKKKDIAMVVKMAEVLGVPLLDFIGASDAAPGDNVHGCIYVNNIPHLVNNREDIENILKDL